MGKYLTRIPWSSVGQLCPAPLLFLFSFSCSPSLFPSFPSSLCPPARGTEDTVPASPGVQTLCLFWQVLPGAAHTAQGCQSSFLTHGLPHQQQRMVTAQRVMAGTPESLFLCFWGCLQHFPGYQCLNGSSRSAARLWC